MKKTPFFYSNLVTLALTVITLIVYAVSVAREHSPVILAALAVAAIVNVILLCKKVPYVEYVPFALDLVSVAMFVTLAFDEVGDVLSNVNTSGLSASWIASAVLVLVNAICAAVNTVQAQKQ
jgi:hypothetical protein